MKEDYPRLAAQGAEVVAISVDHIWAHRAFAEHLGGLPFPLLADWDKSVTRRYGLLDPERGAARRALFVLDREGIIRWQNTAFNWRDPQQYAEALAALAALLSGEPSQSPEGGEPWHRTW